MKQHARQTVMVLNGPNLNLLGQRLCAAACERHGYTLDFRQSNHEGVLIDAIHAAGAAQAQGTPAPIPTPWWRCTTPPRARRCA